MPFKLCLKLSSKNDIWFMFHFLHNSSLSFGCKMEIEKLFKSISFVKFIQTDAALKHLLGMSLLYSVMVLLLVLFLEI